MNTEPSERRATLPKKGGVKVMPFVAMQGTKRVVSLDLDDVQWAALYGQELAMPGCGVRAFPRHSSLGTRFFRHESTLECTIIHKPESPQHRALKAAVYHLIGQTPGWQAVLEEPGPGRRWVADVLAIGPGNRRVAFEIQLSKQATWAWEERTQAYFDDGILPIWITPHTDRYERISLPIVHTGITKKSPLPADPAQLLHEKARHPSERVERSLGYRLQEFLQSGFGWSAGTPEEQRMRHAADQRARAEREEAERREHERRQAVLEAQQAAARAEEEAKVLQFVESALAIDAPPVPAIGSAWATIVTCPTCSARSAVWTCGKTGAFHVAEKSTRDRPERTPWAERAIGRWLAGTGHTKARMLYGASDRQRQRPGFFCPACRHRIPQLFIARIPERLWSRVTIRDNQPPQPMTRTEQPIRLREPRRAVKPAAAKTPASPQSPAAPKPSTLPMWDETTPPEEINHRKAVQAARAAEKMAVRTNPQYIPVSGDWRYRCTLCGAEFDDLREGRHGGGSCV